MGKIDFTAELNKTSPTLYCILCKKEKNTPQFYVSGSHSVMFRVGADNKAHAAICKDCAQELVEYYFKLYRSKQKALYMLCATLDIYYDEEIVEQLKNGELTKLASLYVDGYLVACKNNPKTFLDYLEEQKEVVIEKPKTETDEALSDEDLKNRREIVSIYHYDPFENEPINSRKKLYNSLTTMIDESLRDDFIRQMAALEIVRAFARIDEWTKTIDEWSKDPRKMQTHSKELQNLIATKQKETSMVSAFAKDNGFTERYASSKSRGTGTLSAVMRDIEEFDFDDGKVNYYDIRTSESMQQASDISMNSIMKQLNLQEADYVQMCKEQRERLVKLQQEKDRLQEELRLVYKTIKKEELLKELETELIRGGMEESEVAQAVLAEISYDDKIIKSKKKI